MPRVIKVQRLSFTSIYNEISLTLHTLYYINISLTPVVWKWTLSLTHIVNTKTSLLVCASRAGFSFHFKDSMDLQALYAENNTISFRFQQSVTKLLFTCLPFWLLVGLATIMITVHDQAAKKQFEFESLFYQCTVLLPHRLLRDNY